MSAPQREAAKRRWERTTPEQRHAITRNAVTASIERRRKAHALLNALEASGVTVDLTDRSAP